MRWVRQSPKPYDLKLSPCSVCDVFSRHLGLCTLMASAFKARMTQLLVSSTALHQIYTLAVPCQLSPAERVQRKTKVKDLLCKIFDCKRNRLQCMKHIGQLAQLLPKLLCVQLVTGHSLFWDELRKVARAVNSQPNQQSKLAAIVAIRRNFLQRPLGEHSSPQRGLQMRRLLSKDLAPNV